MAHKEALPLSTAYMQLRHEAPGSFSPEAGLSAPVQTQLSPGTLTGLTALKGQALGCGCQSVNVSNTTPDDDGYSALSLPSLPSKSQSSV